uniref:Uncharacterized protein n=1 Tax=Pristionchus pacificus TaxID=54126 RepID=A0A2A6CW29_PRIPA|eukprot:PDM82338.1 hypothetical protein PRIPAC_36731 [Pristionchus pacificus]
MTGEMEGGSGKEGYVTISCISDPNDGLQELGENAGGEKGEKRVVYESHKRLRQGSLLFLRFL